MIKSVVREHHWPPTIIGGLFIDEEDFNGLVYWYEDVKVVTAELQSGNKKQK